MPQSLKLSGILVPETKLQTNGWSVAPPLKRQFIFTSPDQSVVVKYPYFPPGQSRKGLVTICFVSTEQKSKACIQFPNFFFLPFFFCFLANTLPIFLIEGPKEITTRVYDYIRANAIKSTFTLREVVAGGQLVIDKKTDRKEY